MTIEFVRALRELADWYESHPELGVPELELTCYSMDTKDDAQTVARAMRTFEKRYSDYSLTLKKRFGTISIGYVFGRSNICQPKVVGKRQVPETYTPGYVTPAREEDIIEWDCGSLLDNPVPEAAEEAVGTLGDASPSNYDDKELL